VLNIGFRPADDEDSPFSFDDEALAEGWCAREKRSEVARGILDVANFGTEFLDSHLTWEFACSEIFTSVPRSHLYTTTQAIGLIFTSSQINLPPQSISLVCPFPPGDQRRLWSAYPVRALRGLSWRVFLGSERLRDGETGISVYSASWLGCEGVEHGNDRMVNQN